MRRHVFITLFAFAASACAQQARPPSGVDVDETRIVALPEIQPLPCVSIDAEGVNILLSKSELQRLAVARTESWITENERQAVISAKRAQNFLATVAEAKDANGCFASPKEIDGETQYLVLQQLERGNATVKNSKTGELASTVRVRYLGERCGPLCGRGHIMVYLPSGANPFFVANWWVS